MTNDDLQIPQDGGKTTKPVAGLPVSHEDEDLSNRQSSRPGMENRNGSTDLVPVVSVRNLSKTYVVGQNKVRALRDVSLDVYPGEFVAIMGPSGSGKSTFMNLIGCLDRPGSGNYWLKGAPVSRLSADRLADVRNQQIGFVFQNFNLLPRADALKNVELPLMYEGIPWRIQDRRARKVLKLLGLKARMFHTPAQLSGGQQQRVAIARGLVNDPSLLLADEPTGNLDSRTSVEIMATLQALNDLGRTIIIVSHNPEVAAFAKRRVMFRDGRIVSDEPVANRHIAPGVAPGETKKELDGNKEESKGETPAVLLPPADTVSQRRKKQRRRRRGHLLRANFSSAIAALWSNGLRSLLTMLGIIIGVAAVIAAVTLTRGISELLNENLSGLGTNVLNVTPNVKGSRQSLTAADASAIAQVPHVVHVSPILQINGEVIYSDQNDRPQILGVNSQVQSIGNWHLAEGSWFTSDDEQADLQVVVLGKSAADNLFSASGTDPLDQMIRINGQVFRVVGVLQAKGSQGFTNQDDIVFVPFTVAALRLKNTTYVDQIQVQVDSADNVTQAQQDITTLLEERHHLPVGGNGSTSGTSGSSGLAGTGGGGGPGASSNSTDDFQILNANQLLQAVQQQGQAQATLLIGIAAISLTVGGIGVMNIMLVSVTERTREIGIRMAVGARRGDIRDQFLIEALTLCSLGGIFGTLFGLLGGLALIKTSSQALPFVVSPVYMLLAFGVSATVGIVFGLYPAIRASQLDPIVALRTE